MDAQVALSSALLAGVIAAAGPVATQAVKDAYDGLKALIVRKFGDKADVEDALDKVEKTPASKPRQEVLAEELENAGAVEDAEVQAAASKLQKAMKEAGVKIGDTYKVDAKGKNNATATGNGAKATSYGAGAIVAGPRGVAAGSIGNGNTIVTGDHSTVGKKDKEGSEE